MFLVNSFTIQVLNYYSCYATKLTGNKMVVLRFLCPIIAIGKSGRNHTAKEASKEGGRKGREGGREED